jgi:hypothetical protein
VSCFRFVHTSSTILKNWGKRNPPKTLSFWVHKNKQLLLPKIIRALFPEVKLSGLTRQGGRIFLKISFSYLTRVFTSHSRFCTQEILCSVREGRRENTHTRTKIWHHRRTLRNEARRTTTRAPGRRNRSSPRTRSL